MAESSRDSKGTSGVTSSEKQHKTSQLMYNGALQINNSLLSVVLRD